MVNPKFIADTMREMDYKYFVILDSYHNTVYQQFQPVSIEESIKRFNRFLENASAAMYRVYIYQTNDRKANGEPKGNPFVYEVMLTESIKGINDTPTPTATGPVSTSVTMNGIADPMQNVFTQGGMMGGVGLDKYLGEKDRILELMLRIQQLEMEKKYLEEKLERREAELRRDMEQQMSSETRIQGIINNVLPTFMQGFAGQAPMNGVTSTEHNTTMENNKNAEKETIIASVNKLMKIDPNFAKNIASLANLAEKSPAVYAMAVEKLNSL